MYEASMREKEHTFSLFLCSQFSLSLPFNDVMSYVFLTTQCRTIKRRNDNFQQQNTFS